MQKVCLGVSDLHRSTQYWAALLGMKVMENNELKKTILLGFTDTQVSFVCDFVFGFYSTSFHDIQIQSKQGFLSAIYPFYSVSLSFTMLGEQ